MITKYWNSRLLTNTVLDSSVIRARLASASVIILVGDHLLGASNKTVGAA